MLKQYQFELATPGRGMTNITKAITDFVTEAKVEIGLCNIFLHHTSASLLLCEKADPLVQSDLEAFMQRITPDGDPLFQHVEEGPDDMPSHIRSVLTTNFLTIPITNHQLALGAWQGIFLWEHRLRGHNRKFTVTIQGN